MTDAGNAERLVDRYERQLMLVPGRGWYVWNEDRWLKDDVGIMTRLAIETIRSIEPGAIDKDVIRHKQSSESRHRLQAMIDLASDLPGITVPAVNLDSDPLSVGTPTGMVDLRTGLHYDPSPADLITQSTSVPFDPNAQAPLFNRFLAEVLPDPEVRAFLQRALGYSLTGSVSEEVIFLLVGKGANGKSTLVNTIRRVLGTYAAPVSTSLLTSKFSNGHETDKLALQGIRFAAANETDFGDKIAEAKVKALVSTEAITARGAYQKSAATFNPTHKLWLSTNYLPNIDGSDDGLARRLIVIDFPTTFNRDQRDPNLQAALYSEGAGILRWMIDGAIQWQREGLQPPQAVEAAAADYRDGMDIFARFVEEYLDTDPSNTATNPEMWEAFSRFQATEPNNLRIGRKSFSQAMLRRYKQTNQAGTRRWQGVSVRQESLAALMIRAGV